MCASISGYMKSGVVLRRHARVPGGRDAIALFFFSPPLPGKNPRQRSQGPPPITTSKEGQTLLSRILSRNWEVCDCRGGYPDVRFDHATPHMCTPSGGRFLAFYHLTEAMSVRMFCNVNKSSGHPPTHPLPAQPAGRTGTQGLGAQVVHSLETQKGCRRTWRATGNC